MLDRLVDQRHAAEDVIRVVEALDEVTEALGRVGGQVEDVVNGFLLEELFHQGGIGDRSVGELSTHRNVALESATQVVENHDGVAPGD